MGNKKSRSARIQALEQNKTLNKTPDKILDTKFKNIAFFDPNDLLQVKYEMLRSAQKDSVSVLQASKTYGFSRLSFYKIQKAFTEHGVAGLLPKQRGPHSAHKLTGEVMDFVKELTREKPNIKSGQIKEKINERFNIIIHERSIERAIERAKKKQGN